MCAWHKHVDVRWFTLSACVYACLTDSSLNVNLNERVCLGSSGQYPSLRTSFIPACMLCTCVCVVQMGLSWKVTLQAEHRRTLPLFPVGSRLRARAPPLRSTSELPVLRSGCCCQGDQTLSEIAPYLGQLFIRVSRSYPYLDTMRPQWHSRLAAGHFVHCVEKQTDCARVCVCACVHVCVCTCVCVCVRSLMSPVRNLQEPVRGKR